MKRLFQIVGMMLVVLWVPITSHCIIETVPGLEFLKCPTDTADKKCSDDGCSQIETATYKIPTTQIVVPTVPLVVAFELTFAETEAAFGVDAEPHTTAPPDIPTSWQFSFRSAAPPRAPSFVS